MRKTYILLLTTLFMGTWLSAQVKIGDNPQNIDPSSVLELESTDKVLVITRVTTTQMNAIVPSQGALCYNTDLQAVHFYDGTQWVNIGDGGTGGPLTADPIVNDVSTIVITPTATGDNLEVAPNSISSLQIIDGGVNGIDIQDGSIGPGKLQNNSVTEEKLSENSVGVFAIDNDNLPVSAFNNDVGYLTAGDLGANVSVDALNAITAGSDGGAFYDDSNLMNDVLDNSAAIALDDDQSATNEIQNPTLTGTLIGLSGTAGTIDIGPLISGSGSDNQNIGPISLNASNILSIGIEDGMAGTIDLSALAGGTGALFDLNTISGTGVTGDEYTVADDAISTVKIVDANVTPIKIESSATINQVLTTTAAGTVWADLPPSGGAALFDVNTISGTGITGDEYTVADDAITTVKIVDANVTPIKIESSATVNQVLTTTAAGTVWADLPPSGGAALFDVNTISGTGITGDEYTVADDAITTIKLLDANVTTAKITPAPASAAEQMLITTVAGDVEWAPLASHSSTEKFVFFADTDGTPTTTEDNLNLKDNRGFYWDPEGRNLGPNDKFGALFVGLQGTAKQSNTAKMHIADNFPSGVGYALQVQNYSGSPTGILFSTDTDNAATNYGKGSLIYQNSGAGSARGDFHFLQNNIADTSIPTLTDKAFTVKSNKDIVVYGGIDIDGIGLGTANQVLTSTGAGVQWAAGAGSVTVVSTNTPNSITAGTDGGALYDDTALTALVSANTAANTADTDQDPNNEIELPTGGTNGQVLSLDASLNPIWSTGAGTTNNLATDNQVQDAEDRTYNLSGQELIFNGTGGQIGIGNFGGGGGAPASVRSKLDVDGQISASNGFAGASGSAGNPTYGFFTGGDTNMGMFRAGVDELGFSVGGIEALKIDEPTLGNTNVIVNQSLTVNGSITAAIMITTGATTLNETHHTVILGGDHDITLPPASSVPGRIYIIKNTLASTPSITSFLDGSGAPVITIDIGATQLQSDGTNWQQIN